ncbi:MAG: VWA domain-containing protein [Clostridium sp.]|uniref:VWA domain-containing protein n=1 Tax=Clostridium sp. TaxID=1506 RepID=UPI003EE4A11D
MNLKDLRVSFLGKEDLKIGYEHRSQCNFYSIKLKRSREKSINHHILLIDLSYSMKERIEELKEKVKLTLEGLKKGRNNYVSIIVYSGYLESKIIISGLKCEKKSYEMGEVFEKIDEEFYSRNSTVLSEPLEKAIEMVKRLEEVCSKHNIVLFTDGCISIDKWRIEEEKEKILKISNICKEKDIYFNAIGFGKYYDREFLQEIVKTIGNGDFNHIEEIKDFYKNIIEITKDINEKNNLTLDINNKEYFIINSGQLYKEGKSKISICEDEVLICTFNEELKIENKIYNNKKLEKRKEGVIEDFLYRLTLSYLLNEDIQSAEICMAELKDVYGFSVLQNCYSFTELGRAINEVKNLVINKDKRFKKGKEAINLEEENICILEVLEKIIKDEESMLLWDYSTDYKRIGKITKRKEDRYKFIKPLVGFGEVVDIVIGSKKLNVGLLVKVKGEVIDTDTMLKLDGHVFRQYNLILNGNINTESISCTLSKELLKKFRKEKIIKEKNKFGEDIIYTLNLKKIKTANKRIMRSLTLEEIGEGLYEAEELKCKICVVKKRLEEANRKTTRKKITLKESVRKRYRVNEVGMYKPISEGKEENFKEIYKAKVLEWKIEGFKRKKTIEDGIKFYREIKNEEELKIELKKLKERRNEILYKINLVRIAYGLLNTKTFLWEDEKEKIKIEMDKSLGMNTVVDEKITISTKKVNDIRVRQDKYEILTKCD